MVILYVTKTYLADHGQEFVGFPTRRSHLIHNTTWSSNDVILHLEDSRTESENEHMQLHKSREISYGMMLDIEPFGRV